MGLLRGIDLNKSIAPYGSWIKIYGCTVYASPRDFGHQSVWGFLDLGLMAACLACLFGLCNTLLYRQDQAGGRQGMPLLRSPDGAQEGCGETAKRMRGWRLWARGEPTAQKNREMLSGAGKIHLLHPPRALGDRREILSGAQGQSSVATNPESYIWHQDWHQAWGRGTA